MINTLKNLMSDKPTNIEKNWALHRSRAMSPSELSEINAIFGRYVDDWA